MVEERTPRLRKVRQAVKALRNLHLLELTASGVAIFDRFATPNSSTSRQMMAPFRRREAFSMPG